MIYRLWIDGADYGTLGEHAMRLLLQFHASAEDEPLPDLRCEPVPDDAPVFLERHEEADVLDSEDD